jgi:selenide,water dikinase
MLTKASACPGDALLLSKPLGFGTVTTALKNGVAHPADVAEAVTWMKRLNREASELALEFGLRGGTDVTGFSLLGHGLEMANASQVGLRLNYDKIPFTRGAQRYASQWIFPGGSSDNRLYYGAQVRFAEHIPETAQMLLFDAQTSGGLLLSAPPDRVEAMLHKAEARDQPMWVIGEVVAGEGIDVV